MDETIDKADVVALPVKHRPEKGNLMLTPPPMKKCSHFRGLFTVDLVAGKCSCRECGDEVSAMFVLEKLMQAESLWNRTREAYQDEMLRLKTRSRTKCQHCGQMTRISAK